jgi:hypothetical protein
MNPFDNVISQLVQRIRRSPAGGFVPHAASRRAERDAHDQPRGHGPALSSYRAIYRCPKSTWGTEPGREVDAASPHRHRSATMPFRIFDDP